MTGERDTVRCYCFFFFNDTAPTDIYTLSLHDALPILRSPRRAGFRAVGCLCPGQRNRSCRARDRKSTRLNSSYANISYAVFCLKKKKKKTNNHNVKKKKQKKKT